MANHKWIDASLKNHTCGRISRGRQKSNMSRISCITTLSRSTWKVEIVSVRRLVKDCRVISRTVSFHRKVVTAWCYNRPHAAQVDILIILKKTQIWFPTHKRVRGLDSGNLTRMRRCCIFALKHYKLPLCSCLY